MFLFPEQLPLASSSVWSYLATVPTNCTNTSVFFQEMKQALKMPDYFGENWDAFFDILCDLSWIQQYQVILFHADFPFVDIEKNKIYFDVVMDAIRNWRLDNGKHELVAAFDINLNKKEVYRSMKEM